MSVSVLLNLTAIGFSVVLLLVILAEKGYALWIRLSLIDILAIVIVKRLDALFEMGGHDLISDNVSTLITLLCVCVVLLAHVASLRRRSTLRSKERQLEALRARDGNHWGTIFNSVDDPMYSPRYQVALAESRERRP